MAAGVNALAAINICGLGYCPAATCPPEGAIKSSVAAVIASVAVAITFSASGAQ